jgi:hypothetical protein
VKLLEERRDLLQRALTDVEAQLTEERDIVERKQRHWLESVYNIIAKRRRK